VRETSIAYWVLMIVFGIGMLAIIVGFTSCAPPTVPVAKTSGVVVDVGNIRTTTMPNGDVCYVVYGDTWPSGISCVAHGG